MQLIVLVTPSAFSPNQHNSQVHDFIKFFRFSINLEPFSGCFFCLKKLKKSAQTECKRNKRNKNYSRNFLPGALFISGAAKVFFPCLTFQLLCLTIRTNKMEICAIILDIDRLLMYSARARLGFLLLLVCQEVFP